MNLHDLQAPQMGHAWLDAGGPILPRMLLRVAERNGKNTRWLGYCVVEVNAREIVLSQCDPPLGFDDATHSSLPAEWSRDAAWVDARDAATIGAMLGFVRERAGEPTLHLRPNEGSYYVERWDVDTGDHQWLRENGEWGAGESPVIRELMEAGALVAALRAFAGRAP